MKKILIFICLIPFLSLSQKNYKYEKEKFWDKNTRVIETYEYSRSDKNSEWGDKRLFSRMECFNCTNLKFKDDIEIYTTYYENGNVESIDTFNASGKNTFIFNYDDGTILFEGEYIKRKPFGIWKVYSKNKHYEAYGNRNKKGYIYGEWVFKSTEIGLKNGNNYERIENFKIPVYIDTVIESLNSL